MATKYWIGGAAAVAKVMQVTVTTGDATTTYSLLIGNRSVSYSGSGTISTIVNGLVSAWNTATHIFFTGITASSSGGTTVILTSDTAGFDFTFTTSVSGGTGAFGAVSTTTGNAGPNVWDTAKNWSDAAVPVNGDTVIIKDGSENICWGLDQNAVTLAKLEIRKTYTGRIGLPLTPAATAADGSSTGADGTSEYRQRYLKIGATLCEVGAHDGPGQPSGSDRIKLDLHTAASTCTVFGTASTSAETGKPALFLLANSASTVIEARSAPGGVGLAVDTGAETSTVATIKISDTTTATKLQAGSGVTVTTWSQIGGDNVLNAAGTVTTVNVDGGVLRIEGDYTITTLNVRGGEVIDNHQKSAGNAVTTATVEGSGTLDLQQSLLARTLATVNVKKGGTLRSVAGTVTITTLNEDNANGLITLTAT